MADPSGEAARQESTGSQNTPDESDSTNNGGDITRPQTAFKVRTSDQTSSNDTSKTNAAQTLLRMSSKIPLGIGWRMGLLAQVPVKEETTTTLTHESGLGDATFQAFVAHALSERWAIGVGARLVARTADDDLGTDKWQIMPGFGVRYSLPEEWGADSYFVPTIRYAMSFAGDPAARRISEPQIAPTFNIDLPGPWFFTFFRAMTSALTSVNRNLVRPGGCSFPSTLWPACYTELHGASFRLSKATVASAWLFVPKRWRGRWSEHKHGCYAGSSIKTEKLAKLSNMPGAG
jgi:hypothetical protein